MSEPLSGAGDPPIGRPIWNTRVYVLDAAWQPVPVGVAGELYVGGVRSGARLSGPAGADGGAVRGLSVRAAGERMYRTGDLARWRPDGQLGVRWAGRTSR